jgi:tRNA threonylcarbamoyl adenosine modification protein YjeE
MSFALRFVDVSLARLEHLAQVLALSVQRGDVIALRGDLGAGKTTFARAMIRAIAGQNVEVQSPTFPLVQDYETPRLHIWHFDLYRIRAPEELAELDFDRACRDGLALVEWPERADGAMPEVRLEIEFAVQADVDARAITLTGFGTWQQRLARIETIVSFLDNAAWDDARIAHMQGDASTRSYARLSGSGGTAILMNAPRQPDGPPIRDGMPYSKIAHLAETVHPFVAVGEWLRHEGLSAPEIYARDLNAGLLLLEDLGQRDFGSELQRGTSQRLLWQAAVDVLVHLRKCGPPERLEFAPGCSYELPRFNRAALEIEVSLLLDWYWPEVKGQQASPELRAEFAAIWSPILDRILSFEPGVFLRDFHSPNLIWMPERQGIARVGVIDYQDALAEHYAFDLASLLMDARLDVPADLQDELLDDYCRRVSRVEPDFDRSDFEQAYALFGAQRNTRLLGLWVRLLRRDGKPQYLQHATRTWAYLERCVAKAGLSDYGAWLARNFPPQTRVVVPARSRT